MIKFTDAGDRLTLDPSGESMGELDPGVGNLIEPEQLLEPHQRVRIVTRLGPVEERS